MTWMCKCHAIVAQIARGGQADALVQKRIYGAPWYDYAAAWQVGPQLPERLLYFDPEYG